MDDKKTKAKLLAAMRIVLDLAKRLANDPKEKRAIRLIEAAMLPVELVLKKPAKKNSKLAVACSGC